MRGVASTSISEPSRFSAFSSADGCDNRRTRVRPRRVEQRADEDECLSHQAERRLHWGAGERSNVCFAPLHLVPFGLPARQLVGVSPDEGEMACTNGIANRVKSVGEVVMDAVPNISEAGHRVREVGASAERGVLTPPPPRVFGYSTARAPAPCDLFIERVRPSRDSQTSCRSKATPRARPVPPARGSFRCTRRSLYRLDARGPNKGRNGPKVVGRFWPLAVIQE